MPIPNSPELFLPLLSILNDGKEHSLREILEPLALQLKLSEEEKNERIPSGQLRLYHRLGWARTSLKKAGLLEITGKAKIRITERGLQLLKSNPPKIDKKYLKIHFAEYAEWMKQRPGPEGEGGETTSPGSPEESLETSYREVRHILAEELSERIKSSSPIFFEKLVVDLLFSMGYGGSQEDVQAVGKSGDGGIDGIIKEDKLGLDVIYIQAKRWDGRVGRPVVQGFAGSLEGHRANKGVIITTSDFSQDARDYVRNIGKKIVLIDGEQLAELMIDHGIGVTDVSTYIVKRIDSDYFEEE